MCSSRPRNGALTVPNPAQSCIATGLYCLALRVMLPCAWLQAADKMYEIDSGNKMTLYTSVRIFFFNGKK